MIAKIGYWFLLWLAFSLPFELTQYHLLDSQALVISNLSLTFYTVLVLIVFSLSGPFKVFVKGLIKRKPDPTNFFYRQRLLLALLVALLGVALLSCLTATQSEVRNEGLKWIAQLTGDALLVLGIIFWLSQANIRQLNWLGLALVAGAVIAACVGFLEFTGPQFAHSLDGWFKTAPTMAGPYLRLSGTFEYANIAALYFELTLPFAIVGLLNSLSISRLTWKVAGWAFSVLILLEAMLLTLSRGAWLGLAVGLIAMAVVIGRRYAQLDKGRRGLLVLGFIAGLGLVLTGLGIVLVPQIGLRLYSQSDQDWYKAAYNGAPPAQMTVCQDVTVAVSVHNLGPLTWEAGGLKPYNLSYHWLYPSGQIAQFNGVRSELGANMVAGSSRTVQANVEAPLQPGQYFLVWDMVQEDVSWFGLKSPSNVRLPVQVTALPPTQQAVACSTPQALAAAKEVLPFQTLPQVLEQPDRLVLWEAAVKMWLAHPLWGVGPNGFRYNYGLYTSPLLVEWNKSIYANNFWLEMLADLGLLGTSLMVALVLVLVWPLLRRLKHSEPSTLWQIAMLGALVAFFTHGLVDYVLSSHAINILFWVLLGLAALTKEKYNQTPNFSHTL